MQSDAGRIPLNFCIELYAGVLAGLGEEAKAEAKEKEKAKAEA
jgi:hypothetical protein